MKNWCAAWPAELSVDGSPTDIPARPISDAPKATRQDPLSAAQRHRNMVAIKGRNTKPELIIRRGLHALGRRYRLHAAGLPGKPDLVFRQKRAVIFIHGCFWHGHDCHLFKRPASNTEFWDEKITRNQRNDEQVVTALLQKGWRVLTVWECAIRGRMRWEKPALFARVAEWLDGVEQAGTIEGYRPRSPEP